MGGIAGAAAAAQAHEHVDSSGAGGGQGAWACAKIGGRAGPDALEGSLTLERARAEWANLPLADQLSLMQGSPSSSTPSNRNTDTVSVSEGAAVGARDVACDSDEGDKAKAPHAQAYAPTGAALGWSGREEEEEEDMELIYDPSLGLYFDPKTNSFFARA